MTGLASLALACTAQAQDEVEQPDRDGWLMTSVSIDDLEYIVETQGHEVEELIPENVAVMAMGMNGVRFFMQGTACNAERTCQGLHIWMTFDGAISFERANEINYEYAAISAIIKDRTGYQISRYMILDHGTTMANIKSNLLNTLAIGEQIWISEARRGVSRAFASAEQEPEASDLEALPEPTALEDESIDTSAVETVEPVARLQ
ncbi:MAG: hypothetical protein ACE37M_03945 [Henriciella sp.]